MTNVHATSKKFTSRTTTGLGSRKTGAEITCSGCGGGPAHLIWCVCLMEHRLYRELAPLARQLIQSGRDISDRQPVVWLEARRKARQGLERLVDQGEQREREAAAYSAFTRSMVGERGRRYSARRDRDILDHLLGMLRSGRARTLAEVAANWGRPVAYVKDLRDRALRAMEQWPAANPAAAGARRAA